MHKRFASKAIAIGLILCCALGIGSTSVSWMGTTFSIPSVGESDWAGATKVDGFLVSVGNNALSKAGGTFTLTSEIDFGASYGLKSLYFKSTASDVGSSGVIRLGNTEGIGWRNAANNANLLLAVDSSNNLQYNGVTLASSSGIVPVASGGTGLSSYTTGDTLYASGSTTLSKLGIGSANTVMASDGSAPSWRTIVNADVNASAAIARSKIATGTADHVVINSGAGALTSEATLAVSRGGTNIASYTAGDLPYASGSTTISKLGIGSSGQVLKVSGGLPSWGAAGAALAVTSKTANYTITSNDDLILANSNGGSLLLTLPSAASNSGKVFTVKKTDSSVTCLGIIRAGSDSIRDNSSKTEVDLCTQGEQYQIVSDGSSGWDVIGHRIPSEWVAYTPTFTAMGSPSSVSVYSRRVGDSLEVQGFFAVGTGTASEGRIALGYNGTSGNVTSAGSSKIPTVMVVGSGYFGANSAVALTLLAEQSKAYITFGIQDATYAGTVKRAGNAIDSAVNISFYFKIPIAGWEP